MAVVQTERQIAVDAAALDEFRTSFKGNVVVLGDPSYEEVRAIRNGMIERQPALIAQCDGVADVVSAVNFARENDLLVAIRGGGHNVAGNALCDGGLVIDMSGMNAVRVDPVGRTVRAEGGATWVDVDRETQVFGLVTPGGNVSSTGIAGLSLHGGMGNLRRKFGFSVDNIVSADIVTADGQLRTASATENPDLYWAIRGAGSNFGVVTSIEFKLHPLGPLVALAAPAYPADEMPRILRAWRDFAESAPEEVSTLGVLWSIPAMEMFPEELHNVPVVITVGVYAGPADEGEKVMQPLRELGTPLLDLSGQMPYTALQTAFDPMFPKGDMYYFKSQYVDEITDELLDEVSAIADARPSPRSLIALWHQGGVTSRVGPEETPLAGRESPLLVSLDGVWGDPADNDTNIAWARDGWAAMQRHSSGAMYLNFAGFGEEKEDLLRSGYGPNYERLVQIKNKYDPTNFFRVNNNIRPAG